MLNVDSHSPKLSKDKRMTRREFINNCRGIDGGEDVDQLLLRRVFDSITRHELLVCVDVPPIVAEGESEVVFEAGALGLQLETGFGGLAVVVKRCAPGGQAAALGVKVNQVLVAIHGESVVGTEFAQVMWQLAQAHKPLMLRFRDHDIFYKEQRLAGAAVNASAEKKHDPSKAGSK